MTKTSLCFETPTNQLIHWFLGVAVAVAYMQNIQNMPNMFKICKGLAIFQNQVIKISDGMHEWGNFCQNKLTDKIISSFVVFNCLKCPDLLLI